MITWYTRVVISLLLFVLELDYCPYVILHSLHQFCPCRPSKPLLGRE